jgi:glycine/D-amino acid oxidase-like deaminating enzyme
MTHEFDVAVIGGGLVGGALAYGLARGGHRAALLDEGDIAYRAARGNFGLVWVQGKGLGLASYGSWTQRSARLWPQFARALKEETSIDVALEQRGGFHVCLSDAEMTQRVATLTKLVEQPGFERYAFDVLNRAALAARVPGIGPTVVGATYCALDGHCNPLRLLRALHAAFEKRGGEYLPLHKAERIERQGQRFVVHAAGAQIRAAQVVLAAGLGNAALAPQVELHAPVRPQRGQVIVLERVRPFLAYPLSTLRQTDEGTVLIGDSQEETGFDDSLDTAVSATQAERAVRTFPALRDVRVTRTWAALRVMSPDGFPIYDQSARQPGAFVVTCHSGVTLAAAHALELAPRIAAGDVGADAKPFSAERLSVSKAA